MGDDLDDIYAASKKLTRKRKPLRVRMAENRAWLLAHWAEQDKRAKRPGRPVDPSTKIKQLEIGRDAYILRHTPPGLKVKSVITEITKRHGVRTRYIKKALRAVETDPQLRGLRASLDAQIRGDPFGMVRDGPPFDPEEFRELLRQVRALDGL